MHETTFTNTAVYSKLLTLCPLCGSSNIQYRYTIRQYDPPFGIDICADCCLMFMNPRFNDDVISDLYSRDYYTGKAEYSYYDERDAERYSRYVWEKRLKKIRRYICSGNILDVGCAFGGLLKTASEWFKPYGIDMSDYAGSHARSVFGDSIHIGSLEDHPFRRDFFSVITMIELMEHLKDPVFAVGECYRLLTRGGLLLIQTANMNGLQAKLLGERYAYFMPGHILYFTKKNLVDLLRRTGFSKIKVYYPVEFGLLPKLLKSRYNFKSPLDYMRWLRIAYYHYISKIRFGNFAATSSMVIYAVK